MSAVRSEVEELKDKIAKLEVSSKVYFACWNCILSCDLTSPLHRTTCRRVKWRTAISARTRPRKCSRTCPTSPNAACLVHSTSTLFQLRSLPTLLYSHLSIRATVTSFPHLKKNHLVQGAIYQEPYEVLMHTKHKTRHSLGPTPVSRPRACGHKMNSYSWADSPRI